MFLGATEFNANVTGWNTESAMTLEGMFQGCRVFDQSLKEWSVGNVETFAYMFKDALQFGLTGGNIGTWNTSSARSLRSMFSDAKSFNEDLFWDVSMVTGTLRK